MSDLPLGKRTRLQQWALSFMVLSAFWLLVLGTYSLSNDLNDREVGYLLGVSILLLAELVYLYISAFTNRTTWLIDTRGNKVGVVYDEQDLYLELAEVVGTDNLTMIKTERGLTAPKEGN